MILVYHHVSPAPPADRVRVPEEGWQWRHSPEGLRRQLLELRRRDFRIVPLSEIVEGIQRTGREPARSAALTFDDGWLDNFTHALPVLVDLGVTATFFITT